MENKTDFLDIVQSITCLIRENAVDRLGYKTLEEIKANRKRFYSEVHSDFQVAQNLILENLIKKEYQLELLKNELKIKRREKKYDEIKIINYKIRLNIFRQNVFRKLADSIAWQLIQGQHYIARRFYIGEKPPVIRETNIKDVKQKVDALNKEDNQSFALINDLTSFIQIGDILRKTPNGLFITEEKEGVMNDIARSILDDLEINNTKKLKTTFPDSISDKLKSQILRMHRQNFRANRAVDIINKKGGIDYLSGQSIKILESNSQTNYFYEEIKTLIQESKKRDWAYNVLDECLHIGAYRNNWRNIGKGVIEKIVYEISGKKIEAFNLLENLLIQITEPLFLKPFDDNIIRELLSTEVVVFMALNFDKVIEKFKEKGVSARWLSRKETHKLKEEFPYHNELLIIENQAIELNNEFMSEVLYSGFLIRIVSDNLYPSYAIDLFADEEPIKDWISKYFP